MPKLLRNTILGVLATVAAIVLFNLTWHFPYWAPTEEVTIDSNGVALAATLIRPNQRRPVPAVLLLHGSGPEVRGDPANRAVINALARNGIASFIYDKRGTGDSEGDFESALYRDFIGDALAALEYLQNHPGIDSNNIGLYTVSESGWFGPEIAVRDGNVKFIFGKVACPLSWVDTVAWEVRNEFLDAGVPEADVDKLVDIVRQRWAYYQDAARDPMLASGPRRDALNEAIARARATIAGAGEAMSPQLMEYDEGAYSSFAADSTYDTRPWLAQLDIPQYYAYGGVDVNLPTTQCVAYLQELRSETGRDITVRVYPDAGHSLLRWSGIFSNGLVRGYLDSLVAWVSARVDGA